MSITLSTRDASHVTARLSPKSPLKSWSRTHHHTSGYGQEQTPAKRATSTGTTHPYPSPQPQQHSLSSRQWVVGSKVSKLNRSTARVGLWLDRVSQATTECRGGARPSASAALTHRPRRVNLGSRKPTSSTTTTFVTSWQHTKRSSHDLFARTPTPGCTQRIPLADITPPTSFDDADDDDDDGDGDESGGLVPSPPPDVNTVVHNTGPTERYYRTPSLPAAIDLLTDDEARGLLLRAAQSNLSLAAAIRQVALSPRVVDGDAVVGCRKTRTRAEEEQILRQDQEDSRESFLVDTFVDDPLLNRG